MNTPEFVKEFEKEHQGFTSWIPSVLYNDVLGY